MWKLDFKRRTWPQGDSSLWDWCDGCLRDIEDLNYSGNDGIVDRLKSFLGDWLEGSYWLYVGECVREKELPKMDLKFLAWATKWMVMSLNKIGNTGIRGCYIWGKMSLILVC